MNKIEIDKETKIVLLNVLRNGYFTNNDIEVLLKKIGYTDTPFLELMKLASCNDEIDDE
jgi:hypothetical protein